MIFIRTTFVVIGFTVLGTDVAAAVAGSCPSGVPVLRGAISSDSDVGSCPSALATTVSVTGSPAGSGSSVDDVIVGVKRGRSSTPISHSDAGVPEILAQSPGRNKIVSPRAEKPHATRISHRFQQAQQGVARSNKPRCDSFDASMEEGLGKGAASSAAATPGAYTNADFLRDNPGFVPMYNDGCFCIRWCTEQDGVRFFSDERGLLKFDPCGRDETDVLLKSKAWQLFPDAKILEISGRHILELANVMGKFGHISSLSVHCCQSDNIIAILEALRPLKLEVLTISGSKSEDRVSEEILRNVNFTNLKELALYGMVLDPSAIDYISKQALTDLHLIGCGLTSDTIQPLKTLKTTLSSLSLENNSIDPKKIDAFLKSFDPSVTYYEFVGEEDGLRLVERKRSSNQAAYVNRSLLFGGDSSDDEGPSSDGVGGPSVAGGVRAGFVPPVFSLF